MDVGACNAATAQGHLEVLQYLRMNGCPWSDDAHRLAKEHDHFEIMRYLDNL